MLCPFPPDNCWAQKKGSRHIPPLLQKSPSTSSVSRWFLRNYNKVLLSLQQAFIFYHFRLRRIFAAAQKTWWVPSMQLSSTLWRTWIKTIVGGLLLGVDFILFSLGERSRVHSFHSSIFTACEMCILSINGYKY